jgi:hypothetical protein
VADGRDVLESHWLKEAAELLLARKDEWYTLVADSHERLAGYHLLEHFFLSVGTLMSNQLRAAIAQSLEHVVSTLGRYSEGNDYGSTYVEDQHPRPQVRRGSMNVSRQSTRAGVGLTHWC